MATPNNPPSLSSTSVTIKLDSTNYVLWKMQIEPTLAGQDLFKYVDGSAAAPATTIESGATNPAYVTWYRQDQTVLGWLISSLSPSVIHMLVGVKTAAEAWSTLAKAFGKGSPAQIRSLKTQLLDLHLNNDTVSAYLQKAKLLSDRLHALGHPVADADLVQYVIRGLPQAYRPLIRTIHNRTDTVGFLELYGLLVSEELDLAMDDAATSLTPQVNHTQSQTFGRGRGRRGRGRGYFNSGRGQPSSSRGNFQSTQSSFAPASSSSGARQMTCYNCNGLGHHFRLCPSPRQQPTTPQAHYTTSPAHPNNSWTLDSGATHHLTNDLNNLALHTEYQGTEQVQLSDGLEEPTNSVPRPE